MEDWPPGFRFYPTEDELLSFYLYNKIEGKREDLKHLIDQVIPVVDIYAYKPSELPQFSQYLCHKNSEWFFFVPRQEIEARGGRPRRLTSTGYWKATGTPGSVYSSTTGRLIGCKRTMVFYNGKAPKGRKTEWKMNEYKAVRVVGYHQSQSTSSSTATTTGMPPVTLMQEFSVCRVYKKSRCLRSFDRRPNPRSIRLEPTPSQTTHDSGINQIGNYNYNYDHKQVISSTSTCVESNQNPNQMVGRESTSSSSGYHHNHLPCPAETSDHHQSRVLMANIDDLDWDQLANLELNNWSLMN